MTESSTTTDAGLRVRSVALSAAGLVVLVVGMLLSWSRLVVLVAPVVLGVLALALAVRASGAPGARPHRVVALGAAVVATLAPVVTVVVVVTGVLAPTSDYTITVESPEPVDVMVKNGARQTSTQWEGGDTVRLRSKETVVGVSARAATSTTVISCEVRRDGRTVVSEERAGSVNCRFFTDRG